jgi:hypothetical protein
MFEMRFFAWGLPRWILFLMGVFPLAFAMVFHSLHPLFLVFGVLLTVCWVFLISRGFYAVTRIYLWLMLSGLSAELVFALKNKNLIQVTAAAICVPVFLYSYHWLEEQIRRAFLAPDVKWYEGLPKFFPRVSVEIFWKNEWRRASLRRIDDLGLFLFIQDSEMDSREFRITRSVKNSVYPVRISYRDRLFEGDAGVRSVFRDRWLGMGLQIRPKDLYHFSQYGKIVQILKGEGYAT